MNEIVEDGDSRKIVLSDEAIPFSAYQAIYHKLTQKVEKITRGYSEAYILKLDDFTQLNYRIEQLVAQYAIKGKRCQVSHSVKEGYGRTFSSFEKFAISDMSVPECTSSINYEFDFLIVLPSEFEAAKEVAQRYKLQIRFSQEYIDESDLRFPAFIRDLGHIGGVEMSLEYSDYAVAQAIEATVSGWIKTLAQRKASPWVKFALKFENLFDTFLDSIARTVAAVAGGAYILLTPMSISRAISVSLFALGLAYFSFTVVGELVRRFYVLTRKFAPSAMVLVTKGDQDRHNAANQARAQASAVLAFIFITILVALAVNVLSSAIYDRFVP